MTISIKYISAILLLLLISACSTDPFEPIDIFEEEMLSVDEFGNISTDGDNVMLPVGELCDGVMLWANKERVQQLPGGIQVKGTIFAETEEGITSISSGDFEISQNANGVLNQFSGFGSFLMPEVGLFKDNVDLADLYGAHLNYGSGEAFINQDQDAALVPEDCYFRLTLEESSGFAPGTPSYPALIGNTAISFNTMYVQPEIPAILIKGDMDQYEVKDKPAKVVDGADGKKKYKPASQSVKKKFSIKDVHIGIAAKPHFPFVPNTFSDELEEIVGGTGFESFQGNIYLKGTIPLKKYPIDIIGEAVVKADFTPLGPMEIFENSFDGALFQMGINGTAEFGHEILDFLPFDTRVQLGNATVQTKVGLDESYLRFAGEYDTDVIGEILGEELASIMPRYTSAGKLYGNIGTDLSEWEYYFESEIGIKLPGLGEQKLSETIIHVSPEGIFLSAFSTLPYGIGETKLVGKLERDGTFLLRGEAKAMLELGDAKMATDMLIQLSNDGLIFEGMASLPGGISDFKVAGEITGQRVALSGSQMTNINFGGGARLKTDLSLEASTDRGIFLYGAMETPLDVVMVEVSGEVSARGLALSGIVKSKVDFGVTKLQGDLEIRASTWNGAYVSGMIDVPLVIIGGEVSVEGYITSPTQFGLTGYVGVNLDFGVANADANVCFRFSQSEIKIGASVGICLFDDNDEEQCDTRIGVKFNPNWGDGTVSICIEFLGEHCIG